MTGQAGQAGAIRLLDVRGLEAPEPMIRVLEAVDTLAEGECLRVTIDREPVPLYHVLKRCGFEYRATAQELLYDVLIWLPVDAETDMDGPDDTPDETR